MTRKFTPIFQGNTITIPFIQPVILKGTKEDKNFVFKFNHDDESYYIFVTLQQGVINNNLPSYMDPISKDFLIESVNQYCHLSRQGLPDNVFLKHMKKNASSLKTTNIHSHSSSSFD